MKKPLLSIFCLLLSFYVFADKNPGVHFIENVGQWQAPFDFKANTQAGAMFFTPTGIVYNFYDQSQLDEMHEHHCKEHDHDDEAEANTLISHHAFKIEFLNAQAVVPKGLDKNKYYQNYFLGNDRSTWKSNVATYSKVKYDNLYPNIDLVYMAKEHGMKYEFYVAPNANPQSIALKLSAAKARIADNGNLIIKTTVGDKTELKPVSFQEVDGELVAIETTFELKDNLISFSFPNGYDQSKELIIDPVLIYATYSGGTNTTYGWSAAFDAAGHLYSGGQAFAAGWPVTLGSFQQAFGGSQDCGINKYTITGNGLIYSTYLGGSSVDLPSSMVCTSNDELVVAGYTGSANFPTSAGCFQSVIGGGNDLFITSFDATGAAILGSTFVGGNGAEGTRTQEVNLDANDVIYLSSQTSSNNFPTSAGAIQTASGGGFSDGVVVKMDLNCTTLLAGTYVGGSNADACEGVLIAPNGDVVVTGNTASANFSTTVGAYQTVYQGGSEDGFVTKFNNDLTVQLASSYVGTADGDNGYRAQMDIAGNIYVCGTSDNSAYPVSPGVYSNANGRIFLQKFDNNLATSLLSTKVGATTGFSFLRPTAFLLDVCENVYVSCQGASANLPLSPDALQTTEGGLWVTVLNPNFAGLLYASYIGAQGDHTDGGGSRFDPNGIIYQSACTNSNNFYNTVGAHSPASQSGSWDIASTKIEFGYAAVTASFSTDKADTVCVNEIIQFSSGSASATQLDWDFGDGNTSTLPNPAHAYALPGIYTVSLIAQNGLASCSSIDTVSKLIYVAGIRTPLITAYDDTVCDNNSIVLKLDVLNDNGNFSYSWSPAAGIISGGNTPTPTVDPSLATMYTVQVIHAEFPGYCQDTSTATLNILKGDTTQMAAFPNDTTVCLGEPLMLFAIGGSSYQWEPAASISDPTSSFIIDAPVNNKSYSVTISDAFGCTATKYCNVTVETARADAGKDQIIRFGSSVTLDGSRSAGNTFTWNNSPTLSDNTILNPVASPIVEEEYTLTATTDLGCKDEDQVKVFVTNFTIPNAFTPNGDGNNDVFRVLIANDLVAVKSFRVYNRWGQNVYYTNNKFEGWDGTFKGTPCEGGTYFYLLEVSIGNESYDYKGDINLLR